jgi:methylglutaconyl-CoA hydratase
MNASGPFITRVDHGPVAVLTLNRPERRNALGEELVEQLSVALAQAEVDPAIRSVVITGAGRTFCAGMDLKECANSSPGPEEEDRTIRGVQAIADLMEQVHRLGKPTIAALSGDAYAGGAGLVSACDFVIAAESARLGYPEVRRGLVAAIVMHDLVRQAGQRRARWLLLTGLPIEAAEAEAWGLVNRVVPQEACLAEAIALGRELVAGAPRAIETTKRLLLEATGWPHDLRGAAAVTAQVRVAEEAREGILAFLERRVPSWESRAGGGPDGGD